MYVVEKWRIISVTNKKTNLRVHIPTRESHRTDKGWATGPTEVSHETDGESQWSHTKNHHIFWSTISADNSQWAIVSRIPFDFDRIEIRDDAIIDRIRKRFVLVFLCRKASGSCEQKKVIDFWVLRMNDLKEITGPDFNHRDAYSFRNKRQNRFLKRQGKHSKPVRILGIRWTQ